MKEIIKTLRRDIIACMEKENIPGIAISLIDKDGILWTEGFGYTERSKSRKVDPDTIFCIGSTTKPITAVAFLKAVQKGIVNLDDKLATYYPEFTINSSYGDDEVDKITFRHLLSHFAGLPHMGLESREFYDKEPSFEDYIKAISDTWLVSETGKKYYYSNSGFSLIAYSLQKISNKSYPEYVRDEIVKPLKMESMVYGKKKAQMNPNCAVGYVGPHEALFTDIITYGSTGVYVSVRDLSNFVMFQLNHGVFNDIQILDKELLEEMRKIIFRGNFMWPINYGLGMVINTERIKGFNICGHGGGGHGYSCTMWFIVEHGIGVILLSNQGYHDNGSIAETALKLLLKKRDILIPEMESKSLDQLEKKQVKTERIRKKRRPGPNKEEWRKNTGLYRGRWYGNPGYYGITIENGYLVFISIFNRNLNTSKLKEYAPDIFFNPVNEVVLFEKNTMKFMGTLLQKTENIVSELKKLAETDSNNRDLEMGSLKVLSLILKPMNRTEESLEIQELIYKLYPDDFQILEFLSLSYFEKKDFKRAKEFCEKILKKESRNTKALRMMSQIEKLAAK